MMTWSDNWPDGTLSVKANKPQGNSNMAYISYNMGNQIVGTNGVAPALEARDHFWKISSTYDGRHRFVQNPSFVNDLGESAVPEIGSDMAGVFYLKVKSSDESPDVQKPEPFHKSVSGASGQILQLGFRCICTFTYTNTVGEFPIQSNYLYTHNVKPYDTVIPHTNSGIKRTSQGVYKISFENPLPSRNYALIGSGYNNVNLPLYVAISSNSARQLDSVTVQFLNGNTLHDPRYGSIMLVGG